MAPPTAAAFAAFNIQLGWLVNAAGRTSSQIRVCQREFTTLGISANTDTFVRQKGELGQAPVPTPTFETNKAKKHLTESDQDKLATFKDVNYLWSKILARNGLEGIGKLGQGAIQ